MDWSKTEKELDNLIAKLTLNLEDVRKRCERDDEISYSDELWQDPEKIADCEFRKLELLSSREDVPDGVCAKCEAAENLINDINAAHETLYDRVSELQGKFYIDCTWDVGRFRYISGKLVNGEDVEESVFDEAEEILKKVNEICKPSHWWCDMLDTILPDMKRSCEELLSLKAQYVNAKGLLYVQNETGYKVTGVDNQLSGGTWVPPLHKGKPVTEIGDSAFSGCRNFGDVILPDSVRSIGMDAFSGCTGLTSINLGNGLSSIGEGAFNRCSALWMAVIPDGVTQIGDYAFNFCASITELSLPKTSFEIGRDVFRGCNSLEKIVIPCDVVSEHHDMFCECLGLRTVVFGGTVKSADLLFESCPSLTDLILPTGLKYVNISLLCCGFKNIYFLGSQSEWNEISTETEEELERIKTIRESTDPETVKHRTFYGESLFLPRTLGNYTAEDKIEWKGGYANVYYYSEDKPAEEGNFWHYVHGEPAVWRDE